MSKFIPWKFYNTISGQKALVEKEVNGILYGSIFNGAIKLEWHLDGTRIPRGGTDPFDLTELVSEADATKKTHR